MQIVEGFRVLRVKYREDSKTGHDVFFKPHSVRNDDDNKPSDRTIFAANIPPWATTESIKRIFQPNGPVEAVYFQHQPSVGRYASMLLYYRVFQKKVCTFGKPKLETLLY